MKRKTPEIPINQIMLFGVRDELKADFRSLKADFRSLEAKIDYRFEKMTSEVHRIGVLVEEQNARNTVVLDALIGLNHRQDRFENELSQLVKTFSALK